MTRFGFYILLAMFCMVACQEKKEDYLLSDEQFQQAMFDFELANESVNTIVVIKRDSLMDVYAERIASQYGLTKEQLLEEVRMRMFNQKVFDDDYEFVKELADSLYAPLRD